MLDGLVVIEPLGSIDEPPTLLGAYEGTKPAAEGEYVGKVDGAGNKVMFATPYI